MNTIQSVLNKVTAATPVTKTASEAAKSPTLDQRLNAALEQVSTAKVASEGKTGNPVADLSKIAAELTAVDEESNIKLAHRMGRAFVDGQVERMGEWEKAAGEVAAAGSTELSEAEKRASFEEGFNDTVELIHKTAAAHFVIGHDTIMAAM